jgi:putative tryptophan/tyrosine transport system substrate-binding protein
MNKRYFIAATCSVWIWSLGASAQQPSVPVIGFLNSASPQAFNQLVTAFHKGLGERGYAEGRNVKIEYRWAEGDEGRLKPLAIDLVQRQHVSLIVATGGIRSAQTAKEVTSTTPILFISGANPVELGLVRNINRPAGNATGVSVDTSELFPKRLELLYQLVPKGTKTAMFVGLGRHTPKSEMEFAEQNKLIALTASDGRDLDKKWYEDELGAAVQQGARALLVSADPFYYDRRTLIVALAARYALPTVYPWRAYAIVGGLASYGPSINEAYRQVGVYAGEILKGAKPEDLPVVLPLKWELVINLKTAKALSLQVDPFLLAVADEAIE